MELKLYNTLTRAKEVFRPLDPARVRMYVCGPTVYDHAHIGNARPVIVFDVLYRLLRHLYGPEHVTYARNVTDVDDKINARAAERGVPIQQITEETYRWFKEDVAALGCLEPNVEPRATEYVPQMIEMIKKLIAANHAYPAEGHVLFDVTSKPDYGKLSNRSVDEMIAGARVEVAPYKKNPMDFVLWKPSTPELPGWDSPWGRGRPGWHIECSAMGETLLGPTFDIHGGGIDLVFPHHENEIAQSECAHGSAPLAKVWMHNGFLQVEGEKMAKSAGNFVTIRDLLTNWHGLAWPGCVIRFAMLMTHYRQPFDFSRDIMEQAHVALRSFATFGRRERKASPSTEFFDALSDDLNTPRAIAELHRLLKVARYGDADAAETGTETQGRASLQAAQQLGAGLMFLGIDLQQFDQQWAEKQVRSGLSADFQAKTEILVKARNAARKAKDFEEADRIRDELAKMGVVLKDSPEGTTWEVAR
jgi:cysteinyl-tRNA synthetase